MGAGLLKTREPKSVTAGIWQRGQWDVIGDRSDKREFGIEVIKDLVVNCSEPLKFELEVSCTEPFEESDFVVVQERSLKDVSDPLMLLCMCQQVIDVTRNGGLT